MAKDFVCPGCDHMFQVSTVKLITAKRTKDGKILRCPRCKKDYEFKE